MRKFAALVASVAAIGAFAAPVAAGSGTGPPPLLSCHPANFDFPNEPSTGPCTETDHFGSLVLGGSPMPQCPQLPENFLATVTGNGIQHMTVNAAGDFWFTTTMTGSAVIQSIDSNGNPDPNEPTYMGHLEAWFGAQGNHSNFVTDDVANFKSSSSANPAGLSLSIHAESHFNSTGANPFAPNGSSLHMNASCR